MSYIITNFGLRPTSDASRLGVEMPEGLRRQGFSAALPYPKTWIISTLGHYDKAYKEYIKRRAGSFVSAGTGALIHLGGNGMLRMSGDYVYVLGAGMYGSEDDTSLGVDLGFTPLYRFSATKDGAAAVYVTDGTSNAAYSTDGLNWTSSSTYNWRNCDYVGGGEYFRKQTSTNAIMRVTDPFQAGGTSLGSDWAINGSTVSVSQLDTGQYISLVFDSQAIFLTVRHHTNGGGVSSSYTLPSATGRTGMYLAVWKDYVWLSETFSVGLDVWQTLKCYKYDLFNISSSLSAEPVHSFEWNTGESGASALSLGDNLLVWRRKMPGGLWSSRCFMHPTDYFDVVAPAGLSCGPRHLYYNQTLPSGADDERPAYMTELL